MYVCMYVCSGIQRMMRTVSYCMYDMYVCIVCISSECLYRIRGMQKPCTVQILAVYTFIHIHTLHTYIWNGPHHLLDANAYIYTHTSMYSWSRCMRLLQPIYILSIYYHSPAPIHVCMYVFVNVQPEVCQYRIICMYAWYVYWYSYMFIYAWWSLRRSIA